MNTIFTVSEYLFISMFEFAMEMRCGNNGTYIGPSGVRALPLAASINVGGHYLM